MVVPFKTCLSRLLIFDLFEASKPLVFGEMDHEMGG